MNMNNISLLKYLILIVSCVFISGCTDTNDENVVEDQINYSAANLTLTLIPDELSVANISTLQLILRNEGEYAVNVAKLEEHSTYNIIYSNGSDIEYDSLPSLDLLGDDMLVELKPNDSLSINVSSSSWRPFSKGTHSLSAKYFVTGLDVFTKPHWSGVLRSNNITLIV
jgi:hypothetical protein